MNRRTRRITAAASALAAAGAIGAAGTAQAAGTTYKGNLESGPVSMTFDATKNADGSVTGNAEGRLGIGKMGIMDAAGPVTCIEKQGNKIGLFYPMKKVDPGFVGFAKLGVYMNISTDDTGKVKSVAYSVVPGKQSGGCKPTGGIIPATGNVTTTG